MRDQAAPCIPASRIPASDDHGSTLPLGVACAFAAYRPSGLAWLGDIPAHWRTKPLRFACCLNPTKGEVSHLPADTEVSFVPMEAIREFGGMDLSQIKPIEDVLQGYTYFRDGDIVAAKITPCFENGKGSIAEGLTNGLGFGTTELHTLRPGPEFDTRFLFYLTLSHEFRHQGAGHMYGAGGQKRVPEDFLRNFVAPLPPVPEQRAIAAWLDDRTRRIDDLVAAKQRLIGLLAEQRTTVINHAVTKGLDPAAPMKPSGIDWLGDVPGHWEVKRLKFISHLQTGLTLGKKHTDEEQGRLVLRPYLRVANVQDGWLDLDHITEVEVLPERIARYELRAGDVLMTEGGDFDKLGRGYVYEGQIDGCLHQNHIFAVRPDARRLDSRFLASMMSCLHGRNYFTKTSQQTTNLASTNATKLGDFPIPLPPMAEQTQIMARVAAMAAKLDALTAATETAIARLTEYRQTLISAAITGKINVCGAISAAAVEESPATISTGAPAQAAAAPIIAGRIGGTVRKANKYFHRDVLAAAIIARIGQSATFGWVKLQKALILAEGHLQLSEIESEPVRAAAGPFDNKMMRSIHAQLIRLEWYGYDKNGTPYKYAPLAKAGGHADYFTRYWSGKAAGFDALMALLLPMRTRSAEVLATVYSAWNDFLIEGRAVTDDALVAEVMKNWHPAKQAIPEKNWRAAPPWMRQHGLVPTGHGAHTRVCQQDRSTE
ncbi:Type-1 restriction enzyme EcoKI specificity protein [Phycisphaerales bacterium]|nr:Type-1 restriction enzyme EcoKI specificity protein [Phycisphaerales bacterium]